MVISRTLSKSCFSISVHLTLLLTYKKAPASILSSRISPLISVVFSMTMYKKILLIVIRTTNLTLLTTFYLLLRLELLNVYFFFFLSFVLVTTHLLLWNIVPPLIGSSYLSFIKSSVKEIALFSSPGRCYLTEVLAGS
jgi:hypothetical protein